MNLKKVKETKLQFSKKNNKKHIKSYLNPSTNCRPIIIITKCSCFNYEK